MISLHELSIRLGTRLLIDNANCIFHKGQKIGVTGNNGTGKSTLFALIKGEVEADSGDLTMPPHQTIAEVRQETPSTSSSALDYCLEGDKELNQITQAIAQAEAQNDGDKLAQLHEQLAGIDGHSANSRASKLLKGLGFADSEMANPVSSFSGGWRMRLNLSQALMCRSDILLLDEPTNHLDLHAVVWLQQWLNRYPGTLLLISHDRDFLDDCIDTIAHIEQKQIRIYSGNYSSFEKQRQQHIEQQQAAWQQQQREIAHMESFVTRFKAKATKAKQAQSRVKALERMERIEPIVNQHSYSFAFTNREKMPHNLLRLDDVNFAYPEQQPILEDTHIQLTSGDRIGLIGANGAGKSTLIQILAGSLKPTTGDYELTKDVNIGYFSQHQLDQLIADESPLQHMTTLDNTAREVVLRKHLGSFGFRDARVNEPVKHFSGGEKSRLALALLVYQKPDILLLDEPTNHLDMSMRDALAQALKSFSGALVIVSHDSHMLKQVTQELFLVADKRVSHYKASVKKYISQLKSDTVPTHQTETTNAATNTTENTANQSTRKNLNKAPNKSPDKTTGKPTEKSHQLRKKSKRFESKINKLNEQKNQLEQQLADPQLYSSDSHKDTIIDLQLNKKRLIEEIEQTEQSWLVIQTQLEQS